MGHLPCRTKSPDGKNRPEGRGAVGKKNTSKSVLYTDSGKHFFVEKDLFFNFYCF